MTVNGLVNIDFAPSVVQTTDGSTTVTILTTPAFGNTDDGGQIVTFDVVGIDRSNAEVATAKICVKLVNNGGTPTIVGTPVHLVPISAGSSSGLVTASVNVIVSGTNLKVNVIGVAGRTIDWSCSRQPSFQVLNNLAASALSDGYVAVYDATNHRWKPGLVEAFSNSVGAGGDLAGSFPNPTVANVTGNSGAILINLPSIASTSIIPRQLTDIAQVPGQFSISARSAYTGSQVDGGSLLLAGGNGDGNKTGGTVSIRAGSDADSGGSGGNVILQAGQGYSGNDGYILIGNQVCNGITIQLTSGKSITFNDNGLTQTSVATNLSSTTINGGLTLNTSSYSSATGGAASALPSQPQGYVKITIGNTDYKIPYYNT